MSRTLTIAALLTAAAGFVLQMVAGITDTATIPPGLVVLLAAAALVAFTSWRWAFLVGVAAAGFNLLPFVIVGALDRPRSGLCQRAPEDPDLSHQLKLRLCRRLRWAGAEQGAVGSSSR